MEKQDLERFWNKEALGKGDYSKNAIDAFYNKARGKRTEYKSEYYAEVGYMPVKEEKLYDTEMTKVFDENVYGIIQVMLENGFDVNTKRNGKPFMFMIDFKNEHAEDIIDLLDKAGVNWNARDDMGNSILHHVLGRFDENHIVRPSNASLSLVKKVVEVSKVNINALNDNLETAVNRPIQLKKEVFEYLLSKGLDVTLKSANKKLPINNWVTIEGNKDAVKMLLENNPDCINNKDDGWGKNTPLHSAEAEYIDLLLSLGADAKLTNGKGLTAFEDCVCLGKRKQIDQFIRSGARFKDLDEKKVLKESGWERSIAKDYIKIVQELSELEEISKEYEQLSGLSKKVKSWQAKNKVEKVSKLDEDFKDLADDMSNGIQ